MERYLTDALRADLPIPMIAPRDIAAVAAEYLLSAFHPTGTRE